MNPKTAIKTMLFLLVAVVLFHLSIVLKIVPYEITWGGRLKNDSEMYVFESISILINLLLITILLIKGQYLRELVSMKIVDIALWIFFVLFGLNTVGNIFSETNFEKYFTILTLGFQY
jgi:hypothetical protein